MFYSVHLSSSFIQFLLDCFTSLHFIPEFHARTVGGSWIRSPERFWILWVWKLKWTRHWQHRLEPLLAKNAQNPWDRHWCILLYLVVSRFVLNSCLTFPYRSCDHQGVMMVMPMAMSKTPGGWRDVCFRWWVNESSKATPGSLEHPPIGLGSPAEFLRIFTGGFCLNVIERHLRDGAGQMTLMMLWSVCCWRRSDVWCMCFCWMLKTDTYMAVSLAC